MQAYRLQTESYGLLWTHEQLGYDKCSAGWSPWGASVEHML